MTTEAINTPSSSERGGMILGVAAILIWATTAAGVVWIGRQVGIWQYLAIGNLIACVGQVALYGLLGRQPLDVFRLPPRLWAVAVLGFVIYFGCYVTGMFTARSDAQTVGVGLMNHLWPILTVVFSLFLVPGTRMSARLGFAVVLALGGLALANSQEIAQMRTGSAVLPYVLGGLAGICWALYSALIARWRHWGQHYATAPAGFLMAGLMGVAGCWLTGEWRPISAQTGLVFLYVGLVPHAAGYMLWELALHRAPAAKLGLMASATPVLSTICLLGLFALTGQSRTLPTHWLSLVLGAILIATAVVMVALKPRKT